MSIIVFTVTRHSTIQGQMNPVHTVLFKPNFNIILASTPSFPKRSYVPSTNSNVRGSKSTHAYNILEGTATSHNVLTIGPSLTESCIVSPLVSKQSTVPSHLSFARNISTVNNHIFSYLQVIFNHSNRHLD
jgi:hypothetical protein